MKRVLALVICGGLALFFSGQLSAQTPRPEFSQSKDVVVSATVGSNTLSISGYHSPFASIIVKTQDGTFITSTTADANGYFSISNTLINASVLTYCFQVVDFKRIGLSESCITIPGPIVGNIVYDDVFLPPTIGLSTKKINSGEDATIYGYSMPGATVKINIQGRIYTVKADATGYYSYIYKDVPVGVFTITTSASFEDTESIDPTNNVVLESLSVTQQITDGGEKVIEKTKEKIKKAVPFDLWPFILIGLAFLTAIGILLYKLKFRLWVIFIDFLRRKKKMHHDWFLDMW